MDCLQIYMVNQFLILFMIMPVAIPVAIAAYSIVGEKATRSLEPLLATPITTEELLAGKSLAAAIPAILATWACFAIFLLLSPLTGISAGVQHYLLGPTWILAVILLGPLMAIMAVNFAVIVSSRVNDPRAAEQISMVIIVPVLGVMFGQLGGLLVINVQLVLVSAVVLAALDFILVYFGARLFQRETILTKWR
jgi:ABC-2 type transport system permease protein